eukprot:5312302-Pleurochrysis_carterae.AAC.1
MPCREQIQRLDPSGKTLRQPGLETAAKITEYSLCQAGRAVVFTLCFEWRDSPGSRCRTRRS